MPTKKMDGNKKIIKKSEKKKKPKKFFFLYRLIVPGIEPGDFCV